MKSTPIATIKSLKNYQLWLLGIGAGLIAIHLTLSWKSGNSNLLGTSFLFWAAISSIIWDKRQQLNLESDIFSSCCGLIILAVVLLKSSSLTSFGGFLYLSPFLSVLGLALLASGGRGLKQYQGEMFAICFLGAHRLLPPSLLDISLITAKFSAFILWYAGFPVTRLGVNIHLGTGSIEVYSGCSGIEQIFQQLGLSILVILMFSLKLQHKIILSIVATSVGFIINGVRVAVMGVLVAKGQTEAFKYWHHGDGSLIFSLISVLLLGIFCWFLLQQNQPENQDVIGS